MKLITKISTISLFIVAYAFFFSLGAECMLNILGLAMALSLDSTPSYPRFVPFCFAVGLFALSALIALAFLNLKNWEEIGYTKFLCILQAIPAFFLSLPMIKVWEILFRYLQDTF